MQRPVGEPMIGVNFQPGAQDLGSQQSDGRPSGGSGVQEAIRVLSLRLPKVLGAQSAASLPLLTSQGSGGNGRIDSIVNQIMSRLPQGAPAMPGMSGPPAQDGGGPSFSGAAVPSYQAPNTPQPWSPPPGFNPRVIIGPPPPRWPGQSGYDNELSGRGPMPGAIVEPPPFPGRDFPFQNPTPAPSPVPRQSNSYDQPDFNTPLF
jgi:hypothetical protein